MYQRLFVLCLILIEISSVKGCSLSVFPPDPGSGCCGLAKRNSSSKLTTAADINEYPWMALIEYKQEDRIELLCSAILVSGRYAVSAAQCFTPLALKIGNPVNLRIGEYDITNEGKDCVEVEPGKEVCNDGAISIPIEKTTTHPDYGFRSRHNDIALIRLAETVTYTEFIRPICLPSSDVTLQPPKKFYMTVAGWGASDSPPPTRSNVLRRVKVPFVNPEVCAEKYNVSSLNLTNKQLCAGSKNRDACRGDSGGPLMYFNGHTTELVGIISFGSYICGEDTPGVYTKVFEYKNWIRSVIEADS